MGRTSVHLLKSRTPSFKARAKIETPTAKNAKAKGVSKTPNIKFKLPLRQKRAVTVKRIIKR